MKRKIIALCMVVAMLAVAIVGSTMAYFTDTDHAVNVMVMGNIKIEQHEYERAVDAYGAFVIEDGEFVLRDFTQRKELLPVPYNPTAYIGMDGEESDELGYRFLAYKDASGNIKSTPNAIDKIITVENTGRSDAYVRTILAFEVTPEIANGTHPNLSYVLHNGEGAGYDWSCEWLTDNDPDAFVMFGGQYYDIAIFTYNNVLPAGVETVPSLLQAYLRSEAEHKHVAGYGETLEILAITQAIQAKGFDDPEGALTAGFGEITAANIPGLFGALDVPEFVSTAEEIEAVLTNGGSVILSDDVKLNGDIALNGGSIDGNGNTMDIYDAYNEPDCAIMVTNGGTISNIKIDGNGRRVRAIGSGSSGDHILTEDLYINNVTVDEVLYAINGSGVSGTNVYVNDSTVYGWVSFSGIDSFNFTNCTLGMGNSIDGYMVIYGDTNFTDCTFEGVFDFGGRYESGEVITGTITLTNCTYDGVRVTADNFEELFKYPGDGDFEYIRESTVIVDGVTVNL